MWTLAQARERLGRRLAEVSTVFWDNTERSNAINDAMRLIAAITKGVPETVSGSVDAATPYLEFTGTPVGEYVTAGVADTAALTTVPIAVADAVFPSWRAMTGSPSWAIVDTTAKRVYLAPAPVSAITATVNVAVLPPEIGADNETLFLGHAAMERYQTALVNMAAAYCLLRERYDGDAERFWQFASAELQQLGVQPNSIPQLKEVQA